MDAAQSPQQTAVRQFTTSRFGAIEIKETEIIKFPEGLLGFNHLHEYVLLKDPKQEPFLWLQSLEDPNLAFVVVSPFLFFPGYEINVKAHETHCDTTRGYHQSGNIDNHHDSLRSQEPDGQLARAPCHQQ